MSDLMETERKESMSPSGFIRLYRAQDGDICIQVGQGDENGGIERVSCIEICTPFAGGGGSQKTYAALIQLMAAMAADNMDPSQNARRPERVDEDQQKRIIEWGRQCGSVAREPKAEKLAKDIRTIVAMTDEQMNKISTMIVRII